MVAGHPHAERRDPLDLRARARRGASGRPGCRSASSRPAPGPHRESRPRGRAAPGGRRPTARSGPRRSPAPACRCAPAADRTASPAPAPGRPGTARPRGSTPRCRGWRGCRRSRTGGSRPARGSRRTGCRPRAPPGLLVLVRLHVGKPPLDVLARRAARIARRQQIDVHRALLADRAGARAPVQQIRQRRDIRSERRHLSGPADRKS